MAQAFLNGAIYDQNKINAAQFIERTVIELEIPEGVTRIGKFAFHSCKTLKNVTIPHTVNSIGDYAFQGTLLTSVEIPDSVTSLASYAFQACTKLKSVKLPSNITGLQLYTFHDCSSLESIVIPDSVTALGSSLFHGCVNLESVNLPDKIKSIPVNCFYQCAKIKELVLPSGLTSIAKNGLACTGCEVYDFTKCSVVPTLAEVSGISCSEGDKILVPAALYNEWISATNWSQYADYIQPVGDIPKMEIPDHVSEGLQIVGSSVMGRGSCTDSVVVINQGDNVKCIGMDAFYEDQDIEELYVLGSIVEIDNSVCVSSSLKRLYMENVETICSITLNADALEYVRFSKNISYIGEASLQSKNANVIYDFSAFEGDEIPALYFYTSGDSLTSGVILVPSSRCEEWKTATNWSYYADKIFPV